MKFETTVKDILNVTLAVSNKHGFISSKQSRELNQVATSSIVKEILNSPDKAEAYQVTIPSEFPQAVTDVYEWMLAIEENSQNEYMDTLRIIAVSDSSAFSALSNLVKEGTVTEEKAKDANTFFYEDNRTNKYRLGVLVSAFGACKRDIDRKTLNKVKADKALAEHGSSQHFGEERQRMDLTDVKLVEVKHIAKMDCMIHTFKHGDNIITIFGSQALGAVGDEYYFRATVVRHTEFQGVKQTQMNRIKIAQHRGMQNYD